jgi:hypothetical protein
MIKKLIINVTRILGYQLIKIKPNTLLPNEIQGNNLPPVDLRKIHNNPLIYSYLFGHSIIIEADISRVRRYFFNHQADPYIIAVKAEKNQETEFNKINRILGNYYKTIAPKNPSEFLGLPFRENFALNNAPVWAIPLPWEISNVNEEVEKMKSIQLKENKQKGVNETISKGGWNITGPVSEKKLYVETNRLIDLYESISKNGFERNSSPDGDINVIALIGESNEWKLIVQSGHHRFAVLIALGYVKIPVRVISVVHRKDISIFPNVLSGLYTEDEALKIFDKFYCGQIPDIFKKWLEIVKL